MSISTKICSGFLELTYFPPPVFKESTSCARHIFLLSSPSVAQVQFSKSQRVESMELKDKARGNKRIGSCHTQDLSAYYSCRSTLYSATPNAPLSDFLLCVMSSVLTRVAIFACIPNVLSVFFDRHATQRISRIFSAIWMTTTSNES